MQDNTFPETYTQSYQPELREPSTDNMPQNSYEISYRVRHKPTQKVLNAELMCRLEN